MRLSAPAGSSLHTAVCVWVCSLCDCIKCVYWCVVSAIVYGVYVSCVHVWRASGPSRLQPSTLIAPGSQLLVQLLACAALCELLHQLLCLSFANAFTYLMHNRYCSTQSWAVERTAVVYTLEKEAPGTPCVTPATTLCSAHKCGSPVAREFVSTPVLDCTMLACRSGQEHVLLTSPVSQQLMAVLFVENCTVQAFPGYFLSWGVSVAVCLMYQDLMWWEVAGSTLLPPSAMLCCDMLCGSTRGPGDDSGTTSGCVDLCRIAMCACLGCSCSFAVPKRVVNQNGF